jgi:serine/threonine protein kinase
MGVVLKGFEASLNRYVAIKVLAPSLATNGSARRRFAREAQAAAAVLHENVIAIHRVAEAHDLPYLVMPYVNGVTLQKRIDQEGPLPLVAALRISHQVAAGLAAAHAQGLVHRDIKPANILLERGVERVTITDFGLARAADDASLTRTGVIAGTPQYMSPEQARGDSIDARSDLFSLGSVIYAMCTGHPPFRAETGYGILRRITDARPRSIREINPDVPDWLVATVDKLHAKSPADRFASAEELAQLLQPTRVPLPDAIRQLSTASTSAKPRFGRRVRGWRWALLLLVACAPIGIFGHYAWRSMPPRSPEELTQRREAAPSGLEASGLEAGGQEAVDQETGDQPLGELPWEDGIQDRIDQVGERLELLRESEPTFADQDAADNPTRAPAAADELPPR